MIALIAKNPKTLIATYNDRPDSVRLPDGGVVNGASVGWDNGTYTLVAVTPFATPNGQVNIGAPSYSFDANGNIVETFATQAAPLNVIPFAGFIGRWQAAEYALLMQKRAAAISAGAAQITLVQQWDQALAVGSVDLNSAASQNFKANIVAANILTQARADAIFS